MCHLTTRTLALVCALTFSAGAFAMGSRPKDSDAAIQSRIAPVARVEIAGAPAPAPAAATDPAQAAAAAATPAAAPAAAPASAPAPAAK